MYTFGFYEITEQTKTANTPYRVTAFMVLPENDGECIYVFEDYSIAKRITEKYGLIPIEISKDDFEEDDNLFVLDNMDVDSMEFIFNNDQLYAAYFDDFNPIYRRIERETEDSIEICKDLLDSKDSLVSSYQEIDSRLRDYLKDTNKIIWFEEESEEDNQDDN